MSQPEFIEKNRILAPFTSWLVGGAADYFCCPKTENEIQQAWTWALEKKLPVTFLGGGTNVLISDQGVEGLLICLKNFSGIEGEEIVEGKKKYLKFTARSGTSKGELLKIFLKYKLAPALFLAGLPGDVGGGIVMNAGVAENLSPREFCEIVQAIEVISSPQDWNAKVYQHSEVQWSYRHSRGWQPGLVTKVHFQWPYEPDGSILNKVRDANRVRLSKQPLDKPSCGSVFVNPQGHKAAQLIDSNGLKGFQIGDAQVSMKHANFIVNLGQAKAQEIWQVIQHVKNVVKEKKSIDLQTEVVLLGRWQT
ncbi:MAG: UDP-N-acetylmuramate dehydrogenase [Bdellovibrionota bacterium]